MSLTTDDALARALELLNAADGETITYHAREIDSDVTVSRDDVIDLGIDVADTGTTLTLTAYLIGYLF